MNMEQQAVRRAFASDRRRHVSRAGVRAALWAATAVGLRAATRPGAPARPVPITADPPPKGFFRKAWSEAFAKDAADVAAGLYPPMDDGFDRPLDALRRTADLFADAAAVDARRRRGDGVEARAEADPHAYPAYYRQNFHYQSGGWFTAESARRYEGQVETLFAGAAGPMRRRALSLLARHLKGADQRALSLADLACGSGAFLGNLERAFPRARLAGVDLSAPYLAEAGRRAESAMLIQANIERLPFGDGALDAASCVFLFHELPPVVRTKVAREIARVLKPGGVLAFANSIQPVDEPRLARLLEAFPAYFHEPFYRSYSETDLDALFGAAGLERIADDRAFLTKAVLFRRAGSAD